MEKIKKILESKNFTKVLWIIGLLLFTGVVFQAGMFVGYRKASFSYGLGDNFHRAFGQRGGRLGFLGDFSESSGVSGKILKVATSTVLIEGQDAVEKTVGIASTTVIRQLRNTIGIGDLHINDFVVVLGTPGSNGVISAKFIRVMPSQQ